MKCSHYGCKRDAEESKKQCREHLDYAKDYQNNRRAALIKEGKCTRCALSSRPGKTMCQPCADNWNNYLKTRRAGG